jgi:hypothetical protein
VVKHGSGSCSIFAIRRAWRPPRRGVLSHVRRMETPSASVTNRAGNTRTLASLCERASSATSVTPLPREHPDAGSPACHPQPGTAQQDPAAHRPRAPPGTRLRRKVWIVGGLGGVSPQIIGFIPLSAEFANQLLRARSRRGPSLSECVRPWTNVWEVVERVKALPPACIDLLSTNLPQRPAPPPAAPPPAGPRPPRSSPFRAEPLPPRAEPCRRSRRPGRRALLGPALDLAADVDHAATVRHVVRRVEEARPSTPAPAIGPAGSPRRSPRSRSPPRAAARR